MASRKDSFDPFDLLFGLFMLVILGACAALVSVVVWAVIQLVNHFTT